VLAERARMALARAICTQHQGADKVLHVITLPHDVEVALAQNVERTENGPSLSIDAALIHRLLEGIAAAIERSAIAGNQPVILVSSRIRLALRRLIERHLPAQAVLSYDEITMHPNVTSDGAIDVTQKLAGVAG
jgi:flagellar biosynthesis protein FlhA